MKRVFLIIIFLFTVYQCSLNDDSNNSKDPEITVRAYTADEEIDYIIRLMQNIDFYEQNNYKLSLPSSNVIDGLLEKYKNGTFTDNDLETFKTEFKNNIYISKNYQIALNRINEKKAELKKVFPVFKKYSNLWKFKFPSEYKVCLTLYGPGGAYDHNNNSVIVMTNSEGIFVRNNSLETVVHEMVHIGIEERIIKKYNLSHHLKERIVDKFVDFHFKDLLPEYTLQNSGDASIDSYLTDVSDWEHLDMQIQKYLDAN